MLKKPLAAPESSAARVALWRAMHVQCDGLPHLLEDEIGLQLLDPEVGWRSRPDMDPESTKFFRASIVARARFIEDLVLEQARLGVNQYIVLGAGLDTFAQRKTDIASDLRVFEIDQPGAQQWKRQRLIDLGFGIPDWLHLVPVDFEVDSWWQKLTEAGFNTAQPAVVSCAGVSMYLTREANVATLKAAAALASGSTFVMTFLQPVQLAAPEIREGLERSRQGARASGTPFISFFAPEDIVNLAHQAGFKKVEHVAAGALNQRYFASRSDGLRLPENSEELLVATT